MSSLTSKITPQCSKFGDTLAISGTIEVVLIFIIFIMLISLSVYNNMADPTDPTALDTKKKHIKYLLVTSTIFAFVTACIGIWHIIVSSNVKKCISGKAT